MQNETYYVRSQGKVSGPFDRSQLISKVSIGQLTGVHSVSTDRQSWILARQIDWLFTPTVGIAPRVLPVAAPAPARQVSAVTIDYDIATPGDAVRTTPPRAPARDLLNEQTRYSSPADAPPPTETTATAKAVFISHSSKDAAIANEIVAAVEAAGISCWIDKREIAPAGNYAEDLMVAIQNCRVMLLICSRHSVGSMHVLREVERASHYQQPVLPIRLDDTELTGALEYLISMAQRIDAFPPPISRHFEAIVAGVQSALGMAYAVPSRQRPDGRQKYVGPFRLIEPLGEGGMGAVFKAEQTSPVKRIVAIKLIKAGFDTAEVIARFESERQALARMNHANIARVLDAGTGEQGRPYFVMEFVPGVPITQFADTHRLSIRARLKLFLQVCDAIAHAHSKSILHRDIKAGNVLAFMLDDRPTVKVIDFGIAKALTGERLTDRTLNTSVGKAVGTLASMAPEQAEGSPDVDTRSDVYSLGALLYELLTGSQPFDPDALSKATEAEARRMICEVEPPRPSDRVASMGEQATGVALARQSKPDLLARSLRGELGWIPMMAMRKERQRRYASPIVLAEDIRNYLDARPLIAGPESRVYRFRKFARRNRTPLSVAVILLLALGAGTTAYVRNVNLARAEADKQQRIAATVSGFLSDILSSASPKRGGLVKTVAAAIDEFVGDLDKRTHNSGTDADPVDLMVMASLWNTIGDVQRSLEQYDRAAESFGRAEEICKGAPAVKTGDADFDRTRAVTLEHRGHLFKDQGKEKAGAAGKAKAADAGALNREAAQYFNAAMDAYDESANLLQKMLGDRGSLELATTLVNRAILFNEASCELRGLSANDRVRKAGEDAARAARIRIARSAPTADVLQAMATRMEALLKAGDSQSMNEAQSQLATADSLLNDSANGLKSKDPNRARYLVTKSNVLVTLNRIPEARRAAQEAVDIDTSVFGPDHRYTANARKALEKIGGGTMRPERN